MSFLAFYDLLYIILALTLFSLPQLVCYFKGLSQISSENHFRIL